jgi:hypothetical protein
MGDDGDAHLAAKVRGARRRRGRRSGERVVMLSHGAMRFAARAGLVGRFDFRETLEA